MTAIKTEPTVTWKDLAERSVVTASLVLACVLFVSMIVAPSVIADSTSSGVATAGLLLASAMGGWCYAGQTDRSAAIGVGLGLPLGFFYFQNSYARNAGIVDLASGSGRIMAIAAVVAVVAGVAGWASRRYLG
jgi:hypothetical protein